MIVPYIIMIAIAVMNSIVILLIFKNPPKKVNYDGLIEKSKVVELVHESFSELKEDVHNILWNYFQPKNQMPPEVTPIGVVNINDVSFDEDQEPAASGIGISEIEAALGSSMSESKYRSTYLHDPVNLFKASNGKQVYIRADYHRKISFLLSAAECGCNTITGFLDNLLTEHFSRNSTYVNTILDSRYKNANRL